ncbi:MAG: hypothetical protein RLZZ337_257 [Bacteroidota bacterium]
MLLFTCLYSCNNEQINLSPIPRIEFVSLEKVKDTNLKDSVLKLVFYFEDGDGDIGLTDADTAAPFNYGSPYFHNLPITYLVKNGNDFEELIDPANNKPYGNQHQRIPLLTPTGKNKGITGNLTVSLTANPALTQPNELKFEVKLMDRALNISNTITTPSVQLTH